MGSEASDRMMTLLQELSALKQIDQRSSATPNGSEKVNGSGKKEDEQRLRQQRHEEITEEMKSLAEQKKNSGSSS